MILILVAFALAVLAARGAAAWRDRIATVRVAPAGPAGAAGPGRV